MPLLVQEMESEPSSGYGSSISRQSFTFADGIPYSVGGHETSDGWDDTMVLLHIHHVNLVAPAFLSSALPSVRSNQSPCSALTLVERMLQYTQIYVIWLNPELRSGWLRPPSTQAPVRRSLTLEILDSNHGFKKQLTLSTRREGLPPPSRRQYHLPR